MTVCARITLGEAASTGNNFITAAHNNRMTSDPFDLIPPGNPQHATQSEIGPIIDNITDDDESEETSPT